MKEGDIVICVQQGIDADGITNGKSYTITSYDYSMVQIKDDNGDLTSYYSWRFMLLEYYRQKRLDELLNR